MRITTTRRRTMAFYAEHPRRFEEDRREWDDRELTRHEAEQDRLQARADGRSVGGWRLRSDVAPAQKKEQT